MATVSIKPLAKGHDRRACSSGVAALDVCLKRFARQHAGSHITRIYGAVDGSTVVGFHSLAITEMRRENVPE